MGISYAPSERSACHQRAVTGFSDAPLDIEKQAQEVVEGQNLKHTKPKGGNFEKRRKKPSNV
jgi:hypothetical protein